MKHEPQTRLAQLIAARGQHLTPRQMEIAVRMANGYKNSEISIDLKSAEKTVKNHISIIWSKLEVYDAKHATMLRYQARAEVAR